MINQCFTSIDTKQHNVYANQTIKQVCLVSIYMKIPSVSGNVTADGFKNWIQLESIHHELYRYVKTHQLGDGHNRDFSLPRISAFEIVKHIDRNSPSLCQYFFNCKTISEVNIVLTTNQKQQVYLTYTLNQVMISYFNRTRDKLQQQPIELFHLNYMKHEEQFVPDDGMQQMQIPVSVGYDLSRAKIL